MVFLFLLSINVLVLSILRVLFFFEDEVLKMVICRLNVFLNRIFIWFIFLSLIILSFIFGLFMLRCFIGL